jgi:alpha,alpha-trehalase
MLTTEMARRRPALFLDYDGTLTPIVNDPAEALLSSEVRETLRSLARRCTVAIVSGRDRADVQQLVGLEELIYAGSHGFDVAGPGGLRLEHEGGVRCLPDLETVEQALHMALRPIPGAKVERKKFAVAVHYRNAPEDSADLVEGHVDEQLRHHERLRKSGGKKVFELRPDIEWDKGRAVQWLMEQLDLKEEETLPIYVGDDETDEDAFAALKGRGIGVYVGGAETSTAADYRLADPDEVAGFLLRMLQHLESEAS